MHVMHASIQAFSKFGGVIAVAFEWLALLIYFLRYPSYFGSQYPISYYATLPGTRIAFSVCYLLAAASFYLFIQYHLRNYFPTPTRTFVISMVCFVGTALIPYNPSNFISTATHVALSILTFITFILGIFLMARGGDELTKSVSIAAGIASGTLLASFMLAPKESHSIFALEAGSWFVCQLWILWISYRAFRLASNPSSPEL